MTFTELIRVFNAVVFKGNYTCLVLLIELLLFSSGGCTSTTDLPRSQVLRLHASQNKHLELIRQLTSTYRLDPWLEIRRANSSGHYLVAPEQQQQVLGQLHKHGVGVQVHLEDAHRFLQDHDPLKNRTRLRRSAPLDEFRHKFLSYPELRHFLKQVRSRSSQARLDLGTIGQSSEGRATPYVKISDINSTSPKWTIFIDAGIHGREWISPALTLEIIHRLAINWEQDPDVRRLLAMFDWILVPLVNPDGYAHTFQPGFENRMWRKSRSRSYTGDPNCFGVDINRNFGFHWNNSPVHGGSSNPCSGTFSGPHSFSEPESRNLRNLLLAHRDNLVAYLSFHSFGQFFLYPWGYSSEVDIEDEDDLLHVASAFSKTMMNKNYDYSVGGTAKVLYPAAGGSDDYVRGVVGVKFAYTVELPPHETSRYGFLLPESLVRSVVSDTWDGLKAFAQRLHKHLRGSPRDGGDINGPDTASHIQTSGQVLDGSLQKQFHLSSFGQSLDKELQIPANVQPSGRGLNISQLSKYPSGSTTTSEPMVADGRYFLGSSDTGGQIRAKHGTGTKRSKLAVGSKSAFRTDPSDFRVQPAGLTVPYVWRGAPVWFSQPRHLRYPPRETSAADVVRRLLGSRESPLGES